MRTSLFALTASIVIVGASSALAGPVGRAAVGAGAGAVVAGPVGAVAGGAAGAAMSPERRHAMMGHHHRRLTRHRR